MARSFNDRPPMPSQIPLEYLDCVEIRAYHVDLVLAVDTATFTGRVRIPVHIAGAPRRVLYLHAGSGLDLSSAMVDGAPVGIVKGNASLMRLEMLEEGAISGEQVIDVQFWGVISTSRPEGISMLGDGLKCPPFFPRTGGSAGRDDRETGRGRGDADADAGRRGSSSVRNSDRHVGQPVGFPSRGVLGTHLEPTHARDLFPCVDLPSCKAVFHLTLHGVPAHLQAISNSPILCVETGERVGAAIPSSGTSAKAPPVKKVSFQPTPVMPTYIFGFWVGDFHCLTIRALSTIDSRNATLLCCKALAPNLVDSSAAGTGKEDGESDEEEKGGNKEVAEVEINVHVSRTVSLEGARFALNFSRRAFELFSGLFAVRFPLPKLDILGLPRMHGLGMENFGAITMLEDYMLVTGETSFVRRRRIARLICHEVCHQWYGDIVTPHSFDELWLKEGLARFFEYVAVDALDSSYRVWTNFMSEVFFQAMLADSQKSSHPVVQQHNGDIPSILQSFDTITYCKGASVLRMLCHCVGPSRFLEGTRRFVVDHQYACATQEDLWRAVQTVCDRDEVALNVRDLMRPWLTRAKFPVLRVRMSGAKTLSITQQPFCFHELKRTTSTVHGVELSAEVAATTFPRSPDRCAVNSELGARPANKPRKSFPLSFRNDRSRDGPAAETTSENKSGVSNDAYAGLVDTTAAEERVETRTVSSTRAQLSRRDEGEGMGDTPWVVPLHIRVASGSRSAPDVAVGTGAVGIDAWRELIARGPGVRAGEKMYSFLMSEKSTSIVLGGLSEAHGELDENGSSGGVRTAAADDAARNESRLGGSAGRSLPYLVMNDGHSGFFTVQYECERSWALALAALEEGALTECEATGFVHDLILGLHQRVLVERDVNTTRNSAQRAHGAHSGVAHLLSRLQTVVHALGRDRSNPAWYIGQLFIWEIQIMNATNTIRELRRMYWQRREPVLGRCRSISRQDGSASVLRPSDAAERDHLNGSNDDQLSECKVTVAPSPVKDANTTSEAHLAVSDIIDTATAAAAEEENEDARITAVAANFFHKVASDLELAHKDAEEHVRWYSERVASGVEQAAEPLQSLQAMRDRLQTCRVQLSSSGTRYGSKGIAAPGAGDGNGKVKVEPGGSAPLSRR